MPIDETENSFRIRQVDPGRFDPKSFRTITLSEKEGISAVIACPRGKYQSGRCTVGTRTQSYIFSKAKGWTKEKAKAWFSRHKEEISGMTKPWYQQPTLEEKAEQKEETKAWFDEVNKVFKAMESGE